jgi:hypothetical protein
MHPCTILPSAPSPQTENAGRTSTEPRASATGLAGPSAAPQESSRRAKTLTDSSTIGDRQQDYETNPIPAPSPLAAITYRQINPNWVRVASNLQISPRPRCRPPCRNRRRPQPTLRRPAAELRNEPNLRAKPSRCYHLQPLLVRPQSVHDCHVRIPSGISALPKRATSTVAV